MIDWSDYERRTRALMTETIELRRDAKRRGDYAFAAQMHRLTLVLSSRIAIFERERRRQEHEQLTLVPGRAGRRHDDGDAA